MSIHRRRFVKLVSGGVVAGLTLPLPAPALGGSLRSSLPGVGGESTALRSRRGILLGGRGDFSLLRGDVGIYTARGGTIGWLVNEEGIAVVDAQFPDTATTFLAELPGRATRALDVLINTHHHADHTAGNEVFRGETRGIVAHRRARELHEASGGDRPPRGLADTAFDGQWRIRIGGEQVVARHLGPAHTAGDCIVRFEQANVIHMGDLVFNRAYPFIDRDSGASIRGWLEILETVASEADAGTLFIFGHAREGYGVTGDRDDVRAQADFFSALLDEAGRAIREGRSRDQLMAVESIPGFPDHRPVAQRLSAGLALVTAYDELTGAD